MTAIYRILLLLLLFSAPLAARAEIPAEQKARILILNSYHLSYTWSDNEIQGILETMRRRYPKFEPIIEYLDCKYFPKMEHFPELRDLLRFKYRNISIPLVLAADNPSLEFALRYREEIFPGAPIVFCGINGFRPAMLAGQKRVTGVAEVLSAGKTAEAMLRIHPETKEIYVIHDYTSTGLATRHEAESELKGLEHRVRIRYMDNLSTDGMLEELKKLRAGSLVLALSYSRDRDGRVFDHTQIARLLGDSSPVPVYGAHEERLGHGIIGGALLGGKHHAARAAEIALKILDGSDPDSIPVETSGSSRFMFDYNELVRAKIPFSRLPAESIVINQPESFYRKYKTLVWATVATTVGLLILVFLLVFILIQRRRAEAAIEEKAAQLEKAYGELQEFNSLTYHELQEPLRIVSGFVQLLSRRYGEQLPGEAREFIGFTVSGVSRLQKLFADFLAYTTIGQKEPKIEAMATTEIVAEVRKELAKLIQENDAVIRESPLPVISGDRWMIRHLFSHLIANAVRFRGEAPPEVSISAAPEGDGWHFVISDNGIGISPDYHAKIFQVFKQLDNERHPGGTGIGLAVCRKVVERHGGRIWVDSRPGTGAAFHFILRGGTGT